jgi:alpha-L-arabinofuranosidase
MLWSLANALACSRYHNLLHRHCDLVEIANRSNLINSFCSGIIQTDTYRLYKTPTYYAQQLYATLAGNRLKIDSALPPNAGLDLSATLAADGRTLTVFAVNDTREIIRRPVDLSAFQLGSRMAAVWTLADREHAGEPDVSNSFDYPNRVSPVQSKVDVPTGRLAYRFPALALTVLRFEVR